MATHALLHVLSQGHLQVLLQAPIWCSSCSNSDTSSTAHRKRLRCDTACAFSCCPTFCARAYVPGLVTSKSHRPPPRSPFHCRFVAVASSLGPMPYDDLKSADLNNSGVNPRSHRDAPPGAPTAVTHSRRSHRRRSQSLRDHHPQQFIGSPLHHCGRTVNRVLYCRSLTCLVACAGAQRTTIFSDTWGLRRGRQCRSLIRAWALRVGPQCESPQCESSVPRSSAQVQPTTSCPARAIRQGDRTSRGRLPRR